MLKSHGIFPLEIFNQLRHSRDFSLVECFNESVPPYAILSHTWGADYEEVTFSDMKEKTGKMKAGYRKLTFCAERAAQDGLQFFWVDTCCIDKSSSAELSEAINSMFRYYQRAAICYVYLSDVFSKQDLFGSRWFTRGWTLQELLAPKLVQFFTAEGKWLGDKGTLMYEIHEITGISMRALQGEPLSAFSVQERLLWTMGRQTKREEDAAYSLLGILNAHIPPIYGEGRDHALRRLFIAVKDTQDRDKFAELVLGYKG
ncbi:HET-domain-containing protein [Pyrenochaeta sp. DS3sAY3a]|nr:HET-domain-containing protein [Pyrenochaeta sp. DS3sAY3a]